MPHMIDPVANLKMLVAEGADNIASLRRAIAMQQGRGRDTTEVEALLTRLENSQRQRCVRLSRLMRKRAWKF